MFVDVVELFNLKIGNFNVNGGSFDAMDSEEGSEDGKFQVGNERESLSKTSY
jgi:hypothetical protein